MIYVEVIGSTRHLPRGRAVACLTSQRRLLRHEIRKKGHGQTQARLLLLVSLLNARLQSRTQFSSRRCNTSCGRGTTDERLRSCSRLFLSRCCRCRCRGWSGSVCMAVSLRVVVAVSGRLLGFLLLSPFRFLCLLCLLCVLLVFLGLCNELVGIIPVVFQIS